MAETTQNQTPAADAAAPAPAPRKQLEKANGVTRPGGGATGRVWEIADELSKAAGKPAARKDVIEKGKAEGINAATLATQYGKWRKFYGLQREPRAPSASPSVAPAAAPAADVAVEQK